MGLTAALGGVSGACGGSSVRLSATPAATADAAGDALAVNDSAAPLSQPQLDTAFGQGGVIAGGLADWTPVGVTVDSTGAILVSGPGALTDGPLGDVVRRFLDDGSLDEGFGASGALALAVSADQWGQALQMLAGGSIGVEGAATVDGGSGVFSLRFAGVEAGLLGVPFLTDSIGSYSAGLWQSDGSSFVFGTSSSARLTPQGSLDTSFGTSGFIGPATAGALGPSGLVWTAMGQSVSRYLASGAPDSTFGVQGSVNVGANVNGTTIQSVIPTTSGAIVVGSHPTSSSYSVDVFMLTSSGAVNTGYASGGTLSVATEGAPAGAALRSSGDLLVWTTYGELVTAAADGSQTTRYDLQLPGTLLAATLDATERLVMVGMTTLDPLRFQWFVRRYVLP
jgi:hypothetical protein